MYNHVPVANNGNTTICYILVTKNQEFIKYYYGCHALCIEPYHD